MLRTGRTDRLWLSGGGLAAVALLAIGWFFFVGPQNAQTSKLNDDAAAAQVRLTVLQHQLVELRQQHQRLPQYRAQLARDRQALPTTSGLPDLLRQLQAAGELVGVSVSGIIVGSPSQVTAAAKQVYVLPVTLIATGDLGDLGEFLDQVQQVQPRAVLISGANAVPDQGSLSLDGPVSLTLGVQVFVASASGAETAPPATKTN